MTTARITVGPVTAAPQIDRTSVRRGLLARALQRWRRARSDSWGPTTRAESAMVQKMALDREIWRMFSAGR